MFRAAAPVIGLIILGMAAPMISATAPLITSCDRWAAEVVGGVDVSTRPTTMNCIPRAIFCGSGPCEMAVTVTIAGEGVVAAHISIMDLPPPFGDAPPTVPTVIEAASNAAGCIGVGGCEYRTTYVVPYSRSARLPICFVGSETTAMRVALTCTLEDLSSTGYLWDHDTSVCEAFTGVGAVAGGVALGTVSSGVIRCEPPGIHCEAPDGRQCIVRRAMWMTGLGVVEGMFYRPQDILDDIPRLQDCRGMNECRFTETIYVAPGYYWVGCKAGHATNAALVSLSCQVKLEGVS